MELQIYPGGNWPKEGGVYKTFYMVIPLRFIKENRPGTTSLGEHKQWNVTIQLNTIPSNLDLVAHSVQGQMNVQKHSRILPKRF